MHFYKQSLALFLIGQFVPIFGWSETPAEIISMTKANIHGHKMLYKEGWFVVTSTEKSLDYAKREGIAAVGDEITRLRSQLLKVHAGYKSDLAQTIQSAKKKSEKISAKAAEISSSVHEGTKTLTHKQWIWTQENFGKAWEGILLGHLSLRTRTQADREEFISIAKNYLSSAKSDFKDVDNLISELVKFHAVKIENSWKESFARAITAFHTEYVQSGHESNSLQALLHIFKGYVAAFFHGAIEPTGKEIAKGAIKGSELLSKTVVFPLATTLIVTGRTVESLGLSLYYTSKIGYEVIAPTVQGGLLAGVSLISATTIPVTYVGGHGIGLFNQVAVSTAATATAVASGAAMGSMDSVKYAGLMTYDLAKSTTKIVIKELRTGVVLGYNALTALPTHAVMGAVNSAIFLVWDGPRLLIAKATGELVDELPVGSVVDLNKLQQQKNIKIEKIEIKDEDLQKVLKKAPYDFKK